LYGSAGLLPQENRRVQDNRDRIRHREGIGQDSLDDCQICLAAPETRSGKGSRLNETFTLRYLNILHTTPFFYITVGRRFRACRKHVNARQLELFSLLCSTTSGSTVSSSLTSRLRFTFSLTSSIMALRFSRGSGAIT